MSDSLKQAGRAIEMSRPVDKRAYAWFRLGLGVVFLVSLVSHLAGIGTFEFTGEDEFLFLRNALCFAAAPSDPSLLRHTILFYYPPLQSLVAVPAVLALGATEVAMHLPGALAGAITAVLLYVACAAITGDRKVGLMAAAVYAVSGISGNNKFALTCGVIAPGLLVGFMGLWRFVHAEDERRADRGLFLCAIGMVWAMMTLQDAYFYLPCVLMVYWWKRRFRVSRGALPALFLIVAWMAVYALLWFVLPRILYPGEEAGGLHKLKIGTSRFGTLRVSDLYLTLRTATSAIMTVLTIPLLLLGTRRAPQGVRLMAAFYLPPLLVWVFVLGYGNVRSAHFLLVFPLYCLLMGRGCVLAYKWLLGRQGRLRRYGVAVWTGLVIWMLAATALHSGALYATDRIPDRVAAWLGPIDARGLAQGRRCMKLGQHAVGCFVREQTAADIAVVGNLGGSLADYYCRRPYASFSSVADVWDDPVELRRRRIRGLVIADAFPVPEGMDLNGLPLVAEVTVDNVPTIRIYDLWREFSGQPRALDYAASRDAFNKQYSHWRQYL